MTYVSLAWNFGTNFVGIFLVTYMFTYFLSDLRPYLEHAGTDESKYTNARTFSSRALDFIFGGINYHLAHHLHPRVPTYRIARLQAWLETQENFQMQNRIVENTKAEICIAITQAPYGKERALACKVCKGK